MKKRMKGGTHDAVFGEDSGLHTISYMSENLPANVLALPHRTVSTRIETFDQDLEISETFEFGLGLNPLMYRMLLRNNGGLAAFGSATIDNNSHQYLVHYQCR
ncbi:MAG: hypothetical protein ACI9XO_002504 [Paraglaciecola sp.]|jgi:hypothetical protein